MRTMTPRERDEYRALRATIRDRGTARIYVFTAGMVGWAALVITTAATMTLPVATLLPLVVLAATFEAVFALHVGVERVGRYLQAFHEADDVEATARWEQAAMQFGPEAARGTPDPLFGRLFLFATLANIAPAALAGAIPVEWVAIGAMHLLFAVRVIAAKRLAAGQRARDLARFQALRSDNSPSPKHPGTSNT